MRDGPGQSSHKAQGRVQGWDPAWREHNTGQGSSCPLTWCFLGQLPFPGCCLQDQQPFLTVPSLCQLGAEELCWDRPASSPSWMLTILPAQSCFFQREAPQIRQPALLPRSTMFPCRRSPLAGLCAWMPRCSATGLCSRAPHTCTVSPRSTKVSLQFSLALGSSQWPPSAVCDSSEVPRWPWIY